MQIDRIIYPIESLGPGKRLVIWTAGCSKHCKDCSNEELWSEDKNKDIDVQEILRILKSSLENKEIDGITITGGEPFEQLGELKILLKQISTISNDILVYTGYTMEELQEKLSNEDMSCIKEYISVLIEGRYINLLNDNTSPLRGSSNQNIIFINESMREQYEIYLNTGRRIQNVFYKDKVISVGIHNKEDENEQA